MLILAVDTSGRQGGITLARGASDQLEIIESAFIEGGTFSAELIPQISRVLSRHNFAPQQLEGLVAVTGPGSFTGLRVGLTAIKGLAEVLKLPIATVTSLELLLAARPDADVMAVLDAGRGEFYAALQTGGSREELLLSVAQAAELATSRNLRVIAADTAVASKFADADLIQGRSSEVAARLGLKKLLSGNTVDVLVLDANYVRRSEDEYMQKLKK